MEPNIALGFVSCCTLFSSKIDEISEKILINLYILNINSAKTAAVRVFDGLKTGKRQVICGKCHEFYKVACRPSNFRVHFFDDSEF